MFGVGFIFGTVRVLALEPLLGRFGAIAVELPGVAAVCWRLSRRVSSDAAATACQTTAERFFALKRGVVALLTLLVCEWVMLVTVFGKTFTSAMAEIIRWNRPEARLGLAGQILCSFFPFIRSTWLPQKNSLLARNY